MVQGHGTLHFDGASRGNPGPSGAGAVLRIGQREFLLSEPLVFRATNNVAEYRGLILGLRRAVEAGVTHLEVVGDSELVVRQMTGRYKVDKPHLRALHAEARALARRFAAVTWRTVPRGQNAKADHQASLAAEAAAATGERLGSYEDWKAEASAGGVQRLP